MPVATHSRQQLLDAAVVHVREEGFGALTFGRLARRVGVPDRTVVYYFPTKLVLVTAVLEELAASLESLLQAAFGPDVLPADDLLDRAWPVLTTDVADETFRLFFEVAGLAVARRTPYRQAAEGLLTRWAAWLGPKLAVEPHAQRSAAEALLARLDGLLLLRQLVPEAAERARRHGTATAP